MTCTADCVHDIEADYAACDCAPDTFKTESDICAPCPDGQVKPAGRTRTSADYAADASVTYHWQGFNMSLCTVVAAEPDEGVLLILICVFGSLFVVLTLAWVCFGMYKVRQKWIQKSRAEQRYLTLTQERISKSCAATRTCMFNVCFLRYATFKQSGKLTPHEVHRERGQLFSFDTYEAVYSWVRMHATVFVSHQWLGFTEPDPDNIHFPAICAACDTICAKAGLDERDLYMWVDYVSIPQINNYLKALSISSLAVYASIAKYFVIVAPPCLHHDKLVECNSATYQRRGWCRLEQWARMTVGGLRDMYIYEGGNLEQLLDRPHWYEASVKVFEGDFTVEADKYNIVDPVMGLWYIALLNADRQNIDSLLIDLVNQNKESVFPAAYFEDYIGKLEALVEQEKGSSQPRDHSVLIQSVSSSVALCEVVGAREDHRCSNPSKRIISDDSPRQVEI
ncbi:unnamed protein product [Prorocentrum cordatum]|uniref:TNFR-Cys domain-containing protein n=1 Tax=Prorocentrum cordatum TaxID=2364126 RepID=A0ABN9XTU1_9DINO|nr:unnamed protein product [Polarella glacialis]